MICFAVEFDFKFSLLFSLFVNDVLLKCWYCLFIFIKIRFASTAVAANPPVGHMKYQALSSTKKSDSIDIPNFNTLHKHL